MKLNLTKIRPAGFYHASAFNEIMESTSWALSALGHEVNETENWISGNETNIIFGSELMAWNQQLPKGTILFNLEQPTHPNLNKVQALAQGHTVWDYSKTNVENWKKVGQDVRHVPIGYTPNLTRIPKTEVQDIDVLFFGYLTPRRVKIIDDLKAAGLKVVATDKCYGGGRDNLISRARAVINVHHDGRNLLEIVRLSFLMANSKCIVSEKSEDSADYADLEINEISYEGLVTAATIISSSSDSFRRPLEEASLAAIKKRDFVSTVRDALGEPFAAEMFRLPQQVALRKYFEARDSGDMKDFVAWMEPRAKGKILEIGTRDGASTSAFLMGVEKNGGHVTSLDIQDCSHLFKGHPQWSFIQKDSKDLPLLNIGKFDIILVDGDHSRMGFKTDLDNAWSILNDGGMILCHDIEPEPGQTVEDVPGSDYPSIAVRDEYFTFCQSRKLKHEELPGKYGMGCIHKPKKEAVDSDESWQASEALLQR